MRFWDTVRHDTHMIFLVFIGVMSVRACDQCTGNRHGYCTCSDVHDPRQDNTLSTVKYVCPRGRFLDARIDDQSGKDISTKPRVPESTADQENGGVS